ncbi:MAG: hypothetical protein M3463_08745, partial [Verrucomicrobiota bacterium]|nr:hypothetical protein [Verrucomicrobiota bacterium]
SWSEVQVDAPAELIDHSGVQWYRIRALGIAEIPGGGIIAGDKVDLRLRKFDLHVNRRTGRRVMRPQATRMIEAIVKPVGAFTRPITAEKFINANNHNPVVDSYDSRDPDKSNFDPTNPSIYGTYNPDKRQHNGNIATNGELIDLSGAHIYGDVGTNGGEADDTENVTGNIYNDFYEELPLVAQPLVTPEPDSPTNIRTNADLPAMVDRTATYVVSTISLQGSEVLRITGDPDGRETFATIVVTGDISLSGQSQIVTDPNVFLRIFVVGDADLTGGGIANPNSPLHLQIYGCERIDGTVGSIKIAGNGGMSATVYAPNYDVTLVGGGSTDSVFGSIVGNSISMTGVQSIHYDEALGNSGLITGYKIASWIEDVR